MKGSNHGFLGIATAQNTEPITYRYTIKSAAWKAEHKCISGRGRKEILSGHSSKKQTAGEVRHTIDQPSLPNNSGLVNNAIISQANVNENNICRYCNKSDTKVHFANYTISTLKALVGMHMKSAYTSWWMMNSFMGEEGPATMNCGLPVHEYHVEKSAYCILLHVLHDLSCISTLPLHSSGAGHTVLFPALHNPVRQKKKKEVLAELQGRKETRSQRNWVVPRSCKGLVNHFLCCLFPFCWLSCWAVLRYPASMKGQEYSVPWWCRIAPWVVHTSWSLLCLVCLVLSSTLASIVVSPPSVAGFPQVMWDGVAFGVGILSKYTVNNWATNKL